tara:strand:- start:2110 stop:2688 length:579 start_codon:yes stop_codon:yes gene_type:complete
VDVYEVELQFSVGDHTLSMDEIDDKLYKGGFDDALVGHGCKGRVSIALSRQAASEKELIGNTRVLIEKIFPQATWLTMSNGVDYGNKQKRLDIGVLMEGLVNIDVKTSRGFVDVPENKDALHLARYFGGDLLQATANGLSIQDVINNLGITEKYFMTLLVRRSVLTWLSLRSLRLWQACHSSSGYELKKIDK